MRREARKGEDRLAFEECAGRDGDVAVRVDQVRNVEVHPASLGDERG